MATVEQEALLRYLFASMSLLAIDTCFSACSAAVRNGKTGTIAARFERMDQGHAERLVPMIGEVMVEAGVTFAGLTGVVVSVGPGSFTGVRIGIAAGRALRLAHGLDAYPVSSLALMAAVAADRLPGAALRGRPLVVAVDARRQRLFLQRFTATGTPLSDPALSGIGEAAASVGPDGALAVGSGAGLLAEAAAERGSGPVQTALPDLQPDAAFLLRMKGLRADLLRPVYLRPPDAKPPAAGALRRAE